MDGESEPASVRFSVLGPVSISDGAQVVVLQSAKPISLLEAMLLRPNQVLSVDFLRRAVWDEYAPDTAKATLQTYILRLRRIFRQYGFRDDIIETVPGGYRLDAGSGGIPRARDGVLRRGRAGGRAAHAAPGAVAVAGAPAQQHPIRDL